MRSTFPLFRIFGIPVQLHVSFVILLGILALAGLLEGGPVGALIQLVAVIAVFAGVVLHELGHSLVARTHHIPVASITLYPIGGIARLREMPRRPAVELQVAVAGPLVSLALAGLAAALATMGWLPALLRELLDLVFQVNLILGLFNLLPGFPMDGGRILRSFLAMRRSYLRATQISARLGQLVAAGMFLAAIFLGHILLAAVAIFVFFAAQAELRAVTFREAFGETIRIPGFDPVDVRPFAPPQTFHDRREAPEPGGRRLVRGRLGPFVFWGFFYESGRDPRW